MRYLAMVLLCLASSGSVMGCGDEPEDAGGPEGSFGLVSEPLSIEKPENGDVGAMCTNNLVPTLGGPSSLVTRSGVYSSSYEAWQAFDSNNNTMWISGVFQTPAWISYRWTDGPRTVTSYAINFVNGSLTSRAPRDWTFQGWNGSSWITVDTRGAQTGWLGVERRAYTVTWPGSYSQYRLHVTDDNDTRAGVVVVSMGRLELMGCPPQSPCGDGTCSGSESPSTCPQDCGSCGNGICNFNEDPFNCPQDCWCGDGLCSPGESCSSDCGSTCPHPPCPIE